MGQWSELLPELLMIVHEHLELYPHKVVFTCVCTHWQSTSPVELPDLRQPQPPWLLLPYESGSLCGLYHPLEEKVYEVDLPEVGEKFFVGSDYGWVVTSHLDGSINVVNPLTRVRVPLPPRYTLPDVVEYCPDKVGDEYLLERVGGRDPDTLDSMSEWHFSINKIALSCSPASGEFIAVVHYRSFRLAYCKSGDEKWHDFFEYDATRHKYRDIAFRGGILYALTCVDVGELTVCDDFASCPKLRKCLALPRFRGFEHLVHLINSSHGLMLADRDYEGYRQIEGSGHGTQGVDDNIESDEEVTYYFYTTGFHVYKVDMSSSTVIHMERLDDEILFMGLGAQLSFSYKQFKTCSKGNQIYFANHHFNKKVVHDCLDNGVFDSKDQSIKPFGYECKICLSPIWVTPDPY